MLSTISTATEVLAPVRETEESGADFLAVNLLIIIHRIFQKLSTLTNSRKHSAQDIQLAILCGSDIIACLGMLKRYVNFNTFVLCKLVPCGMVHLYEVA